MTENHKVIESVDYIISFSVSGSSGKQKATREKIAAFEKLGVKIHLTSVESRRFRKLAQFMIEFVYFFGAIFRAQDAIICRSQFVFGSKLISLFKGVPIFYEIHADAIDENRIIYKNDLVRLSANCLAWLQILFYRRAMGVIFNNSDLENHFRKKYFKGAGPVSISVPNGADIDSFYIDVSDKPRSIDPSLYESVPMCLFVGSVSEWHGVHFLIDTFNQIYQEGGNLRLVVAGGGVRMELQRIKKLAESPYVTFVGPVDEIEAKRLMNVCDIALLPVSQIRVSPGSPLKLFDYLACGARVVTQEGVSGYSDIVLDADGFVCDFSDRASASELLLKIAHSKWDRQKIRRYAVEHCCWKVRISEWLEFMECAEKGK